MRHSEVDQGHATGRWSGPAPLLAVCGVVAFIALSLPGTVRAGAEAVAADELVVERAGKLGLSDAQLEEIRELHRRHRLESIQRRADIEIAELELEDLMDDPAVDLATVERKMRELAELRIQDRVTGLQLRQQVHGVLTPEQRDKLDELCPRRGILHLRRPGGGHLFHGGRLQGSTGARAPWPHPPRFHGDRGPIGAARMAARCAEIAARVGEARERIEEHRAEVRRRLEELRERREDESEEDEE